MKGCIWNGEGFRDPAKQLFIHESIRHHKLDFFAILQTGRSDFSAHFLCHLSGGFDFSWYCLPPQGRSGGIFTIGSQLVKALCLYII
jgi:hypothetical protein